ncbi:MAG TPA: T9SS type A sorting domain-containing protein [Puia sp.]|nr:T9SS type A sorting domain-containing protein [Puia sp.]
MKHIYVSCINRVLIIFTLIQILSNPVKAQTSYSINSDKSWSAVLPASCNSCTINIASGITLTVNETATCQNCTFVGGTVSIASKTLNLQYSGGSPVTTNFNGTDLAASGTASIVVNAPISLSNSTFTFSNTSSMTTSYNVSLTSSTIYLNDNSSMTSNGDALTTVSLISDSRIVIGNGSLTSAAIYTVSGPTMIVYDNSTVAVANQNNVFYNWGAYLYLPTTTSSIFAAKLYNTSTQNMNCGSGYSHSCSSPSLYGPATVANGVTSVVTLPITLDGFTGILNSDHTVTLDWNTQMESNFSHFAIERSADGASWEEIGTVEAKGNSAVQTDYSFTDEQPLAGTDYYRLTLVNDDNSYTYSNVVVMQSAAIARISFFPNPAHDYVNVSLGGGTAGNQVTILLSSISGRLMQEKTAATGTGVVVTFPIQNIAAGMYILTVVNADGTRESSPVLISRS